MFVCRRCMIGKTLQEIQAEAPRISIEEFFDTLESNEEVQAYYEKAMRYASHYMAHETRTLTKEMLQAKKPTANQVRAVSIAADHNRWMARSFDKGTFSEKQQAPPPIPMQIITTLELPGATRQLTSENIYDLTPLLPPPAPEAPGQDRTPTRFGERVTDAEFSDVRRVPLSEAEPREVPGTGRLADWHWVHGQRRYGYWDKGPPSRFIGVRPPDDSGPLMPNEAQEAAIAARRAAFIQEGMASLERPPSDAPRQNGTFGNLG